MGSSSCPNCGTAASDRFCPSCGQRQGSELIPTMRTWLSEVLDELLMVEARLPRTLTKLYWPPGELTAQWWAGRRASYVHPLRVYLLVAIPFFFALSMQTAEGSAERGLLEFVVEGTYSLSDNVLSDRNPPMQPLPPELASDSAARAEWRAEFERRRAENRDLALAAERTIQGGVSRVFDALPIVVGIVMVPWLAILLWGLAGPRRPFVAYLVFSMHLHTVLYSLIGLGWLLGSGFLTGLIGGGAYLGVALARIGDSSKGNAIAQAVVVPVFYGSVFIVTYAVFVQGLAVFAPGWVFPG